MADDVRRNAGPVVLYEDASEAFAIAVCTSVFFSLVVARMLTPLMGAYLMKTHGKHADESVWVSRYIPVLKWTLRHHWITIFAGIAFFAASLSLLRYLPSDFMPATDRARSILTIELAPGASLLDLALPLLALLSCLESAQECVDRLLHVELDLG